MWVGDHSETATRSSRRPDRSRGGQFRNERREALIGAFCRRDVVRKQVPAMMKVLPDLYLDVDAVCRGRLGEPRRIVAERFESLVERFVERLAQA